MGKAIEWGLGIGQNGSFWFTWVYVSPDILSMKAVRVQFQVSVKKNCLEITTMAYTAGTAG